LFSRKQCVHVPIFNNPRVKFEKFSHMARLFPSNPFTLMVSPTPNSTRRLRFRKSASLVTALSVLGWTGCSSSGVAPSKTASSAGTGAAIGAVGGTVGASAAGANPAAGLLGGAALGAAIGGIVGMVQDAKDRKEQDKLAQERAYQQELARKRADDARRKSQADEELAVSQGFRISDMELNDAQKKLESASDRLKRLQNERSAALAKKKSLDEAHEKLLSTEAEIARLEEELARLKGEEAAATAAGTTPAAAPKSSGANPTPAAGTSPTKSEK